MLNTKPARFVGGTEGTLMVTLCVHNMQVDQILSLSRPPKKPKITPSTLNMTNSPPPTCLDTQVLCGLVCASNNCLKIFNYHQHWEVNNLGLNICVLRKMMICFQTLISLFQPQPSVLFCSFAESDTSPPAPHCQIMCLCENTSRSKLFFQFCFLDQPQPSSEKNRSSLVCSDYQPGDVHVSGCRKSTQMETTWGGENLVWGKIIRMFFFLQEKPLQKNQSSRQERSQCGLWQSKLI